MKKWKPLQSFLAGMSLFALRSNAAVPPSVPLPAPEPVDPVQLRSLNSPGENLFAGHRSHSSHSSHRSSSGGGYAAPSPSPSPRQAVPPSSAQQLAPPSNYQSVDPGRPAAVSPKPGDVGVAPAPTALNLAEKRRLQIMRVQIALTSLGVFAGAVNGVLDNETKEAIKRFQLVKGMPETGLMTTETLNGLGVPAVQ